MRTAFDGLIHHVRRLHTSEVCACIVIVYPQLTYVDASSRAGMLNHVTTDDRFEHTKRQAMAEVRIEASSPLIARKCFHNSTFGQL